LFGATDNLIDVGFAAVAGTNGSVHQIGHLNGPICLRLRLTFGSGGNIVGQVQPKCNWI